mgnify:CR=1 FL=1
MARGGAQRGSARAGGGGGPVPWRAAAAGGRDCGDCCLWRACSGCCASCRPGTDTYTPRHADAPAPAEDLLLTWLLQDHRGELLDLPPSAEDPYSPMDGSAGSPLGALSAAAATPYAATPTTPAAATPSALPPPPVVYATARTLADGARPMVMLAPVPAHMVADLQHAAETLLPAPLLSPSPMSYTTTPPQLPGSADDALPLRSPHSLRVSEIKK